ncbi:hypothetical protein OX283_002145 [Flavobacterium sp. SUN052]|uniref:hypothetical protein n=1 Tax=Flavobacterium sp. SUN052 TaxID=3002441 RepID=UPI00237DE829|nr:hypothetical protein [Flavobacterium sp. SUN052]MEC4003445.1 hypothetical protein [Flavobacterium sp. SUN052]
MKKIITCIVFALLSHVALQAQEIPFKIKTSDVFKDEYKHSSIVLVEDDGNGGVVIVRSYQGGIFSSGIGYYFEHYDANLKLIKEYEYELTHSNVEKQSSVLGVIMDGDKVNIIDFLYNKTDKAFICSSLTANINDFDFSKTELFRLNSEEIKQFSFFSLGSFDGDSGASMIINEDKTAFAITIDIKDKTAETHKLFLYDNKLNKKFDHTFKREIKDRKFRFENIDVSKDGNTLYLLGKVYTDEKKKKKDGGKYQYELTRITKDSEKTQVFDTNESFAASLKTIIFQDRLTCIGFYSERNDNRFKGICYFELDPVSLDIRKSKFNPFTEQFMIDKYGKDKDKELKNLSFRKILITPENEIVFNAEEFYLTTTYVSNGMNGGGYTRTIYHYDDIVSAKINHSGEIVWARNINKRQATDGDDSYISYTSTIKGNDTFFFINTGEKVKKLSNDRIQFGQTSTKRSNLNIIRIKPTGDFDYQEILDDKDTEVPFMVSNGVLSGESVFFIGRKGKKKQILKVTL